MAMHKGSYVRQKMPAPVEGVITGFKVDGETGKTQVLVEWEEGDGTGSRYFNPDDIEEATPPEQSGPAPE
jgi:hypothetical protein